MRWKARFSVYAVAFLGFLLPLVAFVAIVPSIVNTEPVRARLVEKLNDWSGGQVSIAGTVSISSFFSLSVEVQDVAIRQLKGLPQIAGIQAGKIVARISSFDLLIGNFDFDKIKIHDAAVQVETADVRAAMASLVAILPEARENSFAAFGIENSIIAVRSGPGEPFQTLYIDGAWISLDRSAGQIETGGSVRWADETVVFSARQRLAAGPDVRQRLRVQLESAILSGRFDGETTLAGAWEATGAISARTPDMARLAVWLGFSGDGLVPGSVEIKGSADFTPSRFDLRSAAFTLGGQTASGALTITPGASLPHVEGSLAFTVLDLDGLSAAWQSGGIIPLTSRAEAELHISAGSLLWQGARTGAAAFTLSSKAGVLSAEIAELVFLGGELRGHAELRAGDENARASARLSAENVDAAALFAIMRQRDWLAGRANANIEAELAWDRDGRILGNSTARARVDFPEGGQIRLDIPRLADTAAATITGWDSVDFTSTGFDSLRFELTLKNDRIRCENAGMFNASSIVNGAGEINLASRSLDLRFMVSQNHAEADPSATSRGRGTGTPHANLFIHGAWDRPVIRRGAPHGRADETRGKSAFVSELP